MSSLTLAQTRNNSQVQSGNIAFNNGNYELAKHWYDKAAQQGNVEALYGLGNVYYTIQDYKLAMSWWEKAAKQGHVRAQFM